MFSTFSDVLQEAAAKSPSLTELSAKAVAATKAYGAKRSAATAKKAHAAHQAAYDAHREKHEKKPLGNATYNRMQEHGEFAAHYKRLHASHLESEKKAG